MLAEGRRPAGRGESGGSLPRMRVAGLRIACARYLCCACPSIALPVPGKCRLSRKLDGFPPSRQSVMRLARVIIKLESRQNLGMILSASNLSMALLRRRNANCADLTGLG